MYKILNKYAYCSPATEIFIYLKRYAVWGLKQLYLGTYIFVHNT